MAGIYGSGSSGGHGIYGKPAAGPSHPHGVVGFLENLGKDVKETASGLPHGLVQTVEHPAGTAKAVAHATWQQYSPLFHGHVGQFAHQVYDHPLAPLLDIATVFTGGASVAAKLGTKLAEHGVIDETSALAKLGRPGEIKISDPTGAGRPSLTRYTSENPIHRLGYTKTYNLVSKYQEALPKWFTQHVFGPQAVYERLHHVEVAHRSAALGMQIAAMMKAGETLDKIGQLPTVEHELLAHNYFNLLRHARTIKAGESLPDGWTYVREYNATNADTLFRQHAPAQNFEEFRGHLQELGNRFTTRKASEAATASGGRELKIVPKHNAKNLGREAEQSSTFLRSLWRAPTRVWKSILLGYSPRVVINNGVGNWFMYIMRQSGGHAFRGFVDAVRFAKGERHAARLLKTTGQIAKPHFLREHFGDELGNTFVKTQLQEGGKAPSLLRGPFYPAVHKLADEPVRAAAISAFLRGAPEVRKLMRTKGLKFEDAAREALRRNKGLRDRAALHARTIAGDYFTAGPVERVVRDFVPFYLWDKHIVKHVANLANERPGRLALAAAVGKQGADTTRQQLGDIPDYLLGAIPLGSHEHGGRIPVLSTTGLNPYSTIPELADAALALTTGGGGKPGEAIGSQINPVAAALIEQITGHKLTTDKAPETHGGVIPSALTSVGESLPAAQLIEHALDSQPRPKTTPVYSHDINETLASLAGIPIKRLSKAAANRAATGGKTKKHRGIYA